MWASRHPRREYWVGYPTVGAILANHFVPGLLDRYLARTNDRGALQPGANPKALADATMASIQGGYLVSTTKKDVRPMRNALSAAYAHLRSSRPARPPPVL